ncbi:META domain-containing protein [Aestuariicella hydrocarbonica]|uniref:META domain-containing protein n=1 Tax=Pseudomaricurvus hydrocarbonicus TaxID=1470433 RepID=A0A9E5MGQ4_9GAMM|nr:META domain-containing protein [Aestuariicella hydrocarbonica]NHO65001.1 META domain-containing protein [Aestuariicella hydrocarbonica]
MARQIIPTTCLLALVLGGGCTMKDDAQSAQTLSGVWHVDYIEGRGVIDNSPAHYQFHADNQLSGHATCNQFSGAYSVEQGEITIGELATTRKMCPPALMEQEQRLLEALKRVKRWKTDNGLMYLFDANGAELFRGGPWNK